MEAVSRKTARTPAQVSMDEDANLLRLFFATQFCGVFLC
ncbi:hypothetical protein SEEOR701_07086 [Salmonella enterica subsp. enterica serovar Oranienburg str. 701]|nr:hypothetical protein SEEOR701_07086 [Salmonella enterica subsp. enterica serovar Oranienburg str. 701]